MNAYEETGLHFREVLKLSSCFKLFLGALSSALLKRVGSLLQSDCDQAEKYSRDIRSAKGRNLLCDHVIHVVTPHKAEELTSRIEETLQLAELLKAGSVALPTLGAGIGFWLLLQLIVIRLQRLNRVIEVISLP